MGLNERVRHASDLTDHAPSALSCGSLPGRDAASWQHRPILAAIVGLAAFLRLYRLDLAWFHLDQVRDVSNASLIAAGQALPLLGPHIGGTEAYLGPFYFYLLSVPFLFAPDPIVAVVFVALGSVLALLILYQFLQEYFGASIALNASALFAVFPLASLSSQLVWNPALVPLFAILFMRALYALVMKGSSRSIVWLLALLAILTQLHLATVAFAAVLLLALLVFRPRVKGSHVLLGLGCFLLLYSPYVGYELFHGFANTKAILRFTSLDQHSVEPRALTALLKNVLLLYRPVLSGFITEELAPPAFLSAFSILHGVEAALFGLGLVLGLYELLASSGATGADHAQARRRLGLLFFWLIVPILILGNKKTMIWWYYLDLIYPTQFIFAAIALSTLSSLAAAPPGNRRTLSWAPVGLVVAVIVSQGYFQIALRLRADRQGVIVLPVQSFTISATPSPVATLSAIPLGYRRRILRALVEDFGLDERGFSRRVHGPVLGLPEESRYLLRSLSHRAGALRRARIHPDAHYLVTTEGRTTPGLDVLHTTSVGRYAIVEYRPAIDYATWRCATGAGGTVDAALDRNWKALELPAAELDLDLREGGSLRCAGSLRLPRAGDIVPVVVSVVSWAPPDAIAVHLDGQRLLPLAQRMRQRQVIQVTSSRWMMAAGWATDAVFGVPGSAAPGNNHIVAEVAGHGRIAALDIYEGRPW